MYSAVLPQRFLSELLDIVVNYTEKSSLSPYFLPPEKSVKSGSLAVNNLLPCNRHRHFRNKRDKRVGHGAGNERKFVSGWASGYNLPRRKIIKLRIKNTVTQIVDNPPSQEIPRIF